MGIWFACKCIYIMCVPGTNVGQKRELESLSLELHTVVHSHGQAANGLNSWAISPAPLYLLSAYPMTNELIDLISRLLWILLQ